MAEGNNRYIKGIVLRMRISILTMVFMIIPLIAGAQAEKKYIRQGNREYGRSKYQESEVSYRRAVAENKRSPEAIFNIGDALYRQDKFEEATSYFSENINMNDDSRKKAAGMYNLGNSLLQADKLKESIEAYKGSLRLNPGNHEAKYNLAYAQDLLKQQEQQQQQQDKNNENQDKQDKNKDQNEQNKEQNDSDQKEDQQQKEQQDQEQSISKEDAQRLLNSLANDEKDVQEKVRRAKAARDRKSSVKNW
jgi:tetratricopeptide (TPR) repeat protein